MTRETAREMRLRIAIEVLKSPHISVPNTLWDYGVRNFPHWKEAAEIEIAKTAFRVADAMIRVHNGEFDYRILPDGTVVQTTTVTTIKEE